MYNSFCVLYLLILTFLHLSSIHPTRAQSRLNIPQYDTLFEISAQHKLYFKYIPAGNFIMGSPLSEENRDADEGPEHKVIITKGFYLGVYEVTQAQWSQVMGDNPAVFRTFAASPNHPVESVSWNECQEFIRKLNEKHPGNFRLPTEAEWEYACRAGSTTPYYWGDKMAQNGSSDYTWANSRSFAMTNPVGTKKPNQWDLYDMSGNVWEWCSDWYGEYQEGLQTNPKGPAEGKLKIFRGGSWYDFYESHRSANRHKHDIDKRYTAIGLRLVWEKD